ncbi:MAG: enoyl-CoA hydratase/isomerase family protein, partial [Oleiphilaceae bacterium]|nr:enoyl-CoA hydratase/isomerase family protein [Oleiphilaceae bacterium]
HVIKQATHNDVLSSLCEQTFSNDAAATSKTISEALAPFCLSPQELNRTLQSELQIAQRELFAACQQTSLGEMLQAFRDLAEHSEWYANAVDTMTHGSPLSALIIYEQLKRHRYSPLRTVFISEYQLATNVVRYPEFAEGVRALLIDKDKQPKWAFEHFTHVPASLLESFFSPPWDENPLAQLIPET